MNISTVLRTSCKIPTSFSHHIPKHCITQCVCCLFLLGRVSVYFLVSSNQRIFLKSHNLISYLFASISYHVEPCRIGHSSSLSSLIHAFHSCSYPQLEIAGVAVRLRFVSVATVGLRSNTLKYDYLSWYNILIIKDFNAVLILMYTI